MVKKITDKEMKKMLEKRVGLVTLLIKLISSVAWNIIAWGFVLGLVGLIIKFIIWAWR